MVQAMHSQQTDSLGLQASISCLYHQVTERFEFPVTLGRNLQRGPKFGKPVEAARSKASKSTNAC